MSHRAQWVKAVKTYLMMITVVIQTVDFLSGSGLSP